MFPPVTGGLLSVVPTGLSPNPHPVSPTIGGQSRSGRAVVIMDEFVVPIGLPGLTVVLGERLLPLCCDRRAFGVQSLLPFCLNRWALGVHCPGKADEDGYAVESIGSFENPYVARKLADYRRLNDTFRESVINPVNTPETGLGIVGANGHSDEIFPEAGFPVISIADTSGQGTAFITGDEIVPFIRPSQALLQMVIRHSPFPIDEIKVVRAISHGRCLRGGRVIPSSNRSKGTKT